MRGRLLVLLDYDGTLVPLHPTPAQARLTPRMRRLLRRLAGTPGFRVGIVSGRALGVLRRLVRLPGLVYVGNHGFEIAGAGPPFVHPAARRAVPRLRRLAGELERALRGVPGALVERKRLTLSVHRRRVAPSAVRRWRDRLRAVLAPWRRRGLVRVTHGKQVVEIRPPAEWDKGAAVRWIIRRTRPEAVLYAGDDRTDEAAFRAVNRCGGISVLVGGRSRRTAARYRLAGPAAVERFLEDLSCRQQHR